MVHSLPQRPQSVSFPLTTQSWHLQGVRRLARVTENMSDLLFDRHKAVRVMEVVACSRIEHLALS